MLVAVFSLLAYNLNLHVQYFRKCNFNNLLKNFAKSWKSKPNVQNGWRSLQKNRKVGFCTFRVLFLQLCPLAHFTGWIFLPKMSGSPQAKSMFTNKTSSRRSAVHLQCNFDDPGEKIFLKALKTSQSMCDGDTQINSIFLKKNLKSIFWKLEMQFWFYCRQKFVKMSFYRQISGVHENFVLFKY